MRTIYVNDIPINFKKLDNLKFKKEDYDTHVDGSSGIVPNKLFSRVLIYDSSINTIVDLLKKMTNKKFKKIYSITITLKEYRKVIKKLKKMFKIIKAGGGVVKKELKSLKKGAETLKGKNIAKADKVAEDYETKKKSEVMAALKKRTLDKKTKNKIADDIVKRKGDTSKSDDRYAYESVMSEAERKLADRLARKRKVYDKTTKKAMQFARDEGEASGHARYRMSSISREMDGIRAKMKKEG